ncbi:MAG: hypothetical protein HFJ81_01295 [Clostridia bacterium]|nr:hypothetical protein [Clostridia bacterium]
MAQVELFKKVGKYIDKRDGKEKPFTNFFVKCGSETIPVEVKFFESEDGKDYRYSSRKAVLSAFAEELPEKPKTAAETASN